MNPHYGLCFRVQEEDLRHFAEEPRTQAETNVSLGREMAEVHLSPGGRGGNQYEELARDRYPMGLKFRWSV